MSLIGSPFFGVTAATPSKAPDLSNGSKNKLIFIINVARMPASVPRKQAGCPVLIDADKVLREFTQEERLYRTLKAV
jgi:hypothetical protein